MSDDDFFSDGDHKSGKNRGLMPIVEVPSTSGSTVDTSRSASGSTVDTARSEEPSPYSDTHRSDYDDSEGSGQEETPRTGRSTSRKHKHKTKNGKISPDMTPPDKLLSKARKKAKKYWKNNKADKALAELIRCTALARIVYGDGHWKLAQAYANLAQGYFELKGYAPQAQFHAETARSVMLGGVQTSGSSTDKATIMEVLINIHYILGRALATLKRFSEAEQALMKAEKVAVERAKQPSVTDDDIDSWDVKIYIAIAKLSSRQQKFAMAANYFDKALDLLEGMYGKDSPELIPVYQGLGSVEQSKGPHADQVKAIEHYLQAHSIASTHHKEGSVEVAETAHALATAYANVGGEDAETSAESYLNECLATYQSTYGPNHEKTLDIQDELAKLMIRTTRYDEAIDMLRTTIEAKKEVYGEISLQVSETWKLIGSVYLSDGDSEKALRSLKKCHNLECTLYGVNNKKSKETQRTIDILMANPNLAAKQRRSKADELKDRPRFNNVVGSAKPLGGFKPSQY